MNVQVKSCNGITLMPLETRLLANRNVFIEGEISQGSAGEFAKQIMLLNMESESEPIKVFINSNGGEISEGMCMYDVIQGSAAPIELYCLGKAYSMAAILFSCGNYGRFMLPHAELMLHEPLLGNRVSGNATSIQSISDSLLQIKEMINCILVRHTGNSKEEIEKATSFNNYFTPEESIAFGLCDQIIGFEDVLGGR